MAVDTHIVHLHEFGALLGSRSLGMQVRTRIEQELDDAGGHLVVDASGVSTMSHSFADECFGKLVEHRGLETLVKVIEFRNVSPSASTALRYVVGVRSRREP